MSLYVTSQDSTQVDGAMDRVFVFQESHLRDPLLKMIKLEVDLRLILLLLLVVSLISYFTSKVVIDGGWGSVKIIQSTKISIALFCIQKIKNKLDFALQLLCSKFNKSINDRNYKSGQIRRPLSDPIPRTDLSSTGPL